MRLVEGFFLTLFAATASSMQGWLANQMGLRFSWIAEHCYIAVPVVFLVAVLAARRKKRRDFFLACYLIAVSCIALPFLIVALQSVKIPVAEGVSPEALSSIRAIYGDHIVITQSNGQTCAYIPRSVLNSDVADAISELEPTPTASDLEK